MQTSLLCVLHQGACCRRGVGASAWDARGDTRNPRGSAPGSPGAQTPPPEGPRFCHFPNHLSAAQPERVDVSDGVLGESLVDLGRGEDGASVAAADVVTLAVLRLWVVDLEEELQQLAVGQPIGIEDDLDRVGVAGMV